MSLSTDPRTRHATSRAGAEGEEWNRQVIAFVPRSAGEPPGRSSRCHRALQPVARRAQVSPAARDNGTCSSPRTFRCRHFTSVTAGTESRPAGPAGGLLGAPRPAPFPGRCSL